MLANKEFITASRNWVCVRLDSYESVHNQNLIRKYLNGRFENTAFVLLSPDCKPITRKGSRSPLMTFGSVQATVDSMNIYSLEYERKNKKQNPNPQDFESIKTSLNVASADQRPLIVISSPKNSRRTIYEKIRNVFSHKDLIGRFHFDFEDPDGNWSSFISGISSTSNGLFIIFPDEFGQKGKVLKRLPIEIKTFDLIEELKSANLDFTRVTPVKNYSAHIKKGRALNIFFEPEIPYGEDRNGDGVIDHRGGLQGRRRK